MADPAEAPDVNPFDQLFTDKPAGLPQPANNNAPAPQQGEQNPFDQYFTEKPVNAQPETSATGAFARHAALSAVPAIGSLPVAGAGAEIGGEIGLLGGPWGALAGGLAGGVLGFFGGQTALDKAQDYVLSKLPEKWKDALGISESQRAKEETEHPTASFIGGLAPYALTMRPGGIAKVALPENATALQRIWANPVTQRLFPATLVGGMELGQEKAQGQPADWQKVGIATAFGLIFNRPTRFGERITEIGARPARAVIGRPEPTIAQAADAKVMGPGVTEQVFQGAHEQNESAAMTAQETARQEAAIMGEPEQAPDVRSAAQSAHPELFAHYADLFATRNALEGWIAEQRAEVAPAAVKHLEEVKKNLDEITPEVQAAYRRTAEAIGAPIIEPLAPAAEGAPPARPIEEQRAFIRNDVAEKLIAAGRPAEEAQAAGALMAARYETRAARFNGALGTAEELYRREGPEIRGPGGLTEAHTPTGPRGPAARDETKFSLLEYLASRGGIRSDDAMIEDLRGSFGGKNRFIPGFGQIIRTPGEVSTAALKSGRRAAMSLDTAREAAEEAGYLPRGASINDLLEAIDNETRGQKTYREGFAPERAAEPGEEESAKEALFRQINDYLEQNGGKPLNAAEQGRAWHVAQNETLTEPEDIVERLALEFYQRRRVPRSLIAEREAEGQLGLPGTERVTQGELAQRKANEPLRPSVEQKPMDEGLFGSDRDQKELFQQKLGKIMLREGARPIITLAQKADASTFIHETGHLYLDELMRDAAHEAAPEGVKADASAVQKWLGIESADDIKTRHHEKFARGFEQYLREGTAPSPGLARVFAQFRDWLLKIYESIKGLGPEINEDIRGVFDRLLASEPQRTVIARDLENRPTLQDIHESDAKEIEPHEAEPAMDRTLAEADRFVAEPPPQVAHEIEAAAAKRAATEGLEPSGEAATGAEPGGLLEPDRGGPGPVSASGLVRAERGAELSGSGNAGREGAELSRPESGGAPGAPEPDLGDKPLAPRPSTLLGAEESPFIDRAGNIRLDTLTSSEDVRQAIRASAHENDDFIGDRRGVVTDGQVMDLAEDLGMVGAEKLVKERVIGQAFNAEQIMALRKLLIQSATDVSAAMKKAAKDGSTDADVLAYASAKDRHQMIQATVAQATAEAGRALRAFRNIKEDTAGLDQILRDATGKTLFQLRQEARLGSTLSTPQQVSKFMNDAKTPTFWRMLLEYWINGLISGPATHTTYAIGNNILMLEKLGPETATAAMVGRLRQAMGRQGETVRMGEVAAGLAGMRRAVGPALKASVEAFRTGVTTALPGENVQNLLPFQQGSELATPAGVDEAAKISDALGSAFGVVRGIYDGFAGGGALLAAGGREGAPLVGARYSHLGVIPDIELRGVNVLPLGTAVRLPSRFIAAIHSYFRVMNYSIEKAATAYRIAANEGLTGEAFDARVGDLRQNPTAEMMASAHERANQLTLMGQGGEFTQALSRLTNTPILGVPIFKFIDPFVKISSNIIEQSLIARTPIGILSPEIRADLMGKNGNVAQDMATARMLVGTAYALAIGGLAAEGYVSGSGPSDPRQAAIWRLAGNQAHSVRIGETWYDVHRLGPMGMLMGVAADLYEVAHKASEGDMLNAASVLQHAVTQNILDESFMRGPSDLIKAVDDPGRYGEAYIRSTLSSFVPYSVGLAQMARASDPYSRQARSVLDAIKQKVPILSQELLPRRDIWGEEMPNKTAFGAAGVTAIYEQRMSHDSVNLALNDLGIHPAQVARKIRNVDLTDEQYDDFQRIAGRMTKMRLDAIARSPQFQTWPNHTKRDVITEVITQSREAARGVMMMKYPQIVKDATQARLKKLKD